MSVKIRLQRHGKKGKPYFHIVVADARAPRDGRYIERLGTYNPNTDPATVEIDVDSASSWLQKGAQPTDTARAILSYRGVLYRNHLNRGVLKGALSQEDADKKFEAWVNEKDAKIQAKVDRLSKESDEERKARLKAEAEVSEKRAAEIVAKNTPEPEPEAEAAPEAEATEEAAPAAEAEAPAQEAKAEAPAEEKKEEAPEAKAEETPEKEEKKADAPEAKAEEAPEKEEKKADAPEAKAEEAPAEEKKADAPEAKAEEAPEKEEKKADAPAEEKADEKKAEAAPEADAKKEEAADEKSEDADEKKDK